MTRKPSGPNHIDMLSMFERMVTGDAKADRDFVKIPTPLAQYILDVAKRAPAPQRGPRMKSIGIRTQEALVIAKARRRKSELEAGGLSASKALHEAAEEASMGSHLSASVIKDRMQRKRS